MKIAVRFNTSGGGDVVAMTPVIEALKVKYPSSLIAVETSWPEVFENNPFVHRISSLKRERDCDLFIDLNVNYASYNLICEEAARIADVKLVSKAPTIVCTKEEREWARGVLGDITIGVSTQIARSGWAGRNWGRANTREFIELLKRDGYKIVELGKDVFPTGAADLNLVDRTTRRELFAIISELEFLVTVDSLPLHVAQACPGVFSVALFGATSPQARISELKQVAYVHNSFLDCLECFHKKGKSTWNKCDRQPKEECMRLSPFDLYLGFLLSKEGPQAVFEKTGARR